MKKTITININPKSPWYVIAEQGNMIGITGYETRKKARAVVANCRRLGLKSWIIRPWQLTIRPWKSIWFSRGFSDPLEGLIYFGQELAVSNKYKKVGVPK